MFYCLVPKIINTSPLEILSQRVTKALNESMNPNWNFERVGRWGRVKPRNPLWRNVVNFWNRTFYMRVSASVVEASKDRCFTVLQAYLDHKFENSTTHVQCHWGWVLYRNSQIYRLCGQDCNIVGGNKPLCQCYMPI